VQFSAATRAWFEAAFAAPTDAQRRGWEAIGRDEHTLIAAPTGSGKTLAAFLWALDRLMFQKGIGAGCRVLYVSPLKALAHDVARNLQAPLVGISQAAARLGLEAPSVEVAIRTGDTPPEERRQMARRPPDILVTTPESLYLLLSSKSKGVLAGVELVIVDEIHSVAGSKRGAHLALSLERLERLCRRPPQRVGLSATQRPLEEVARFLGGQVRRADGGWERRPVTVIDAGVTKEMDLQVVLAAATLEDPISRRSASSMESGAASQVDLAARSVWPATYGALLELIRAHRSTLIFVNSRRLAERLAARLNELAAGVETFSTGGSGVMAAGVGPELVRAHHGSVSKENRAQIEDDLKAGRLPALVATSSLELGIDMGAVDLVVQVEAPPSVSSGLQRVGRAGHHVGRASKGRIFPKYRHDLLVSAAVCELMRAGAVEPTRVVKNPLDVLAQQVVAEVAASESPVPVAELLDCVKSAYPFADLPLGAFEGVLDMLAGRYPSEEFAELRPRLIWNRAEGTLTARPGAKMLAVTSGGTIPERGLYGVFTPGGGRVGELDEEMVYESRVGEAFVLGATSWRIEEITKDKVIVTPAPGVPAKMPFWHGDGPGRPFELGQAIGSFVRTLPNRSDQELLATCGLDQAALANLRAYLAEEAAATGGVVPSDRQLVVERFKDELGDWRVAILSPFGARVHAPWALAIETQLRRERGVECQVVWGDDGILLRLPEAEDPPELAAVLVNPDEVEDLVVAALGASALFAARFRENAARALVLPRRRPGSRTPLWLMRQRAADLLEVASRYGSFPVLVETYRECLSDVFDLPALKRLLADVSARRVRVCEVELDAPSPFASGLVFSFVAQYLYEGDAPLAEKKAQALSLDRRLLEDLLGSEELEDLLDPDVIDQVEAELQGLSPSRRARSVEEVADLLRRVGDLSRSELASRCEPPSLADRAWSELCAAKRAVELRVAGETRLVAVEDAATYRDGLGVALPLGLAPSLLGRVDDPLFGLVGRWARTHGPFGPEAPARRFALPPALLEPALERLVGTGRLVRGELATASEPGRLCDAQVLRLIRRRTLALLRRQVEPVDAGQLARFLPAWQGVAPVGQEPPAGGLERLWEVIGQLEGLPLPAGVLERDVLAARVRRYDGRMLDELLSAGELIWVGAGAGARQVGRVVLARRQNASLLSRLGYDGSPAAWLDDPLHRHIREVLQQRGACFFRELVPVGASDQQVVEALWDLVWAGEVTGDSFGALRATLGAEGRSPRGRSGSIRPRLASLRLAGPGRAAGRWSLVRRELEAAAGFEPRGAACASGEEALVKALLERHGVLTRPAVRHEGPPGGFSSIYRVLSAMEQAGRLQRGYFLEGLGGSQFCLPGAVERLREAASSPGSGPAYVLAATDPANPLGATLGWPVNGPGRHPGAYVVIVGGRPVLYLERGGAAMTCLAEPDGSWENEAIDALGCLVESGRWRRLYVRRWPAELEAALEARGFVPTPKGMLLGA